MNQYIEQTESESNKKSCEVCESAKATQGKFPAWQLTRAKHSKANERCRHNRAANRVVSWRQDCHLFVTQLLRQLLRLIERLVVQKTKHKIKKNKEKRKKEKKKEKEKQQKKKKKKRTEMSVD